MCHSFIVGVFCGGRGVEGDGVPMEGYGAAMLEMP